MYIRILADYQNHKAIGLRVADNRVDHRGGSHATVVIFLPKNIQRSDLEEFSKDTSGLKEIMKTILEKSSSPLR